MALKPDREVYITDIEFTCDAAAEAGAVLIYAAQPSGHGTGVGYNETSPVATVQGTGTPASGTRIAGVLMHNVEDIYASALLADGTPSSGVAAGIRDPQLIRTHRNWHKTTQVVGENVTLLKDGKIVTNMISGTPQRGDPAYLAADSKFSPTQLSSLPSVGKFITGKDAAGYAKISVKIA